VESVRLLRADQVGSLLRPPALLEARAAQQAGRLSEADLSRLEDEAILTALKGQAAAAQQIYVDGEFRRTGFMTGVPDSVDGFVPDTFVPIAWKGGTGSEGASPNTQLVIGQRLRPKKRIAKNEADFLKRQAPGPFKVALPSPVNFAVIFWRKGVSDRVYSSPHEFLVDAAGILAAEARALAREGTPYIQLDAPLYTHWADTSLKEKYSNLGFDMERFLDDAIAAENMILDAARPAVTGVHLCRGNSMGRWLAEGGYEPDCREAFQRTALQ
jgi:5-methyltetrahydropteroyltriglutamate--homocysteine methyltransferase